MPGFVIAVLMARESTRRFITEPRQEHPRASRRAAARVLQWAAHRLDPRVCAPAPAHTQELRACAA